MADFFVDARTAADLGWSQILAALAERTRTVVGREQAIALPYLSRREEIGTSLARIEEVRALLRINDPIPVGGVEDVRAALCRATKDAVLAPSEILACARVIQAAAQVKRYLATRREAAPLLAQLGAGLSEHGGLAREIDAAIEPSGHIRDNASYLLTELRNRTRQLHQGIKERIEQFLHDPDFAPNLQDSYFSVRGDRYVLPINASFRSKVPGIIHNASQSGQTVFVEPQEIVPLGNELAIAESMASEEERRILASFSSALGALSEPLIGAVDTLAALDVVQAAGVLAQDLDAAPAELADPQRGIALKSLRHPLLQLQGKRVIGNDVMLDAEQRALVISGPNAGGKTVTLTGVGLCALMTRAGLPIPAAPGSRLPVYRGVCCAVGDAQDLGRGLSTFSAHLHALKRILEVARDGWLVLIDEIAADTDPQEGAALARASLEALVAQQARVLLTTHLEEVKALGVVDKRFVNARVGFDPATLAPTFRLEIGVAGVSNALAVAANVGLPTAVLASAREHLAGTGLLSAALAQLESTQRDAESLRERVAAEHRAILEDRATLSRLTEEANQARREARASGQRAWVQEVETLRKEVTAIMARLQAAPTIRRAQEVQAALTAQSDASHKELRREQILQDTPEAAPAGKLGPGSRVKVISLGNEGEVVQVDGDTALVAIGNMRSRIKLTELIPLRASGQRRASHFPGTAKKAPDTVAAGALPQSINRCDVRGLRADEALSEVDRALDHSYSHGSTVLMVVHGHGTGALQKAVREALAMSPYVAKFRPGDRHEGGDGVTVAELST